MSWRNRRPKRAHFDTQEEYYEAVNDFYNELADEADAVYEERRLEERRLGGEDI
jgi:hypothetical protein